MNREDAARKVLAGIAGLTGAQKATLIPTLYAPDPKLGPLLKKVDGLMKKKAKGTLSAAQKRTLGYTLEKVVLLSFQGLVGINAIKSYQSAGPQHDLLVKGIDELWRAVCQTINLPEPGGMLIESKATTDKVGDKEFERLGNIVTHHFRNTVAIGIFFAIEGATGFPRSGQVTRSASLKAACLTQAVIYYSANKPIVVLDWTDIRTLDQPGALLTLLERKVREIEEMSGLREPPPPKPVSVDLPKHLKPLSRF